MQLDCEVCHAPLRAEDVRTGSQRMKCPTCTARERPPTRDKAARPTNIQVEESEQRTVLSWRWLSLAPHIFMALVCLFWNGSLVMTFRVMLETDLPLAAKLFSVLLLGGGVVMTYVTLAGFLNTTRIEANRDALTIRHGPLPWRGNRTLPGRELTQLYGKECSNGERHVSYNLCALDTQEREVTLLKGLEKDQVLFLEQALERPLGIEDRPVEGEVAQRTAAG